MSEGARSPLGRWGLLSTAQQGAVWGQCRESWTAWCWESRILRQYHRQPHRWSTLVLREQRTGSNCRAETCPIVKPLNSSPSSEIGPMCSSVQFLDCSFGNKYKQGLTIDIVFGKMHELAMWPLTVSSYLQALLYKSSCRWCYSIIELTLL